MSFRNYAARFGFACLVAVVATGEAHAQATLTLQDAFARAMQGAPSLRAAEQARLGAEAGVRQADRLPNPSLDITAENVLGSGLYSGLNRAEATFALSQRLEWGGDRQARAGLAVADVSVAKASGDVRRQNLLHEIELAYLGAQKAGADFGIAEERVKLAREIVTTVDRRVQAARDPLMAGARAKALLVEAEIAAEAARRSDLTAKARLASYWGGEADFTVDAVLFEMAAVMGQTSAQDSPELAVALAEEGRALAAVEVERAKAQQDANLSAGVRYFQETGETALVVGFSIPLPLWDRNDGAIARAEAERSRLRFEGEALKRNVEREIYSASTQMEIANSEIEAIDQQLIPSAEQALTLARQGYAAGGFSYLDVLDAQRIVVEARLQRNSALFSYHSARVALARLTGAYASAGAVQ